MSNTNEKFSPVAPESSENAEREQSIKEGMELGRQTAEELKNDTELNEEISKGLTENDAGYVIELFAKGARLNRPEQAMELIKKIGGGYGRRAEVQPSPGFREGISEVVNKSERNVPKTIAAVIELTMQKYPKIQEQLPLLKQLPDLYLGKLPEEMKGSLVDRGISEESDEKAAKKRWLSIQDDIMAALVEKKGEGEE